MHMTEQPVPFMVTRRKMNLMFGSSSLVKRMAAAGWLVVVRPGRPGRETLYDYQSAQRAFARLKAGEEPPPLAYDLRARGGTK